MVYNSQSMKSIIIDEVNFYRENGGQTIVEYDFLKRNLD